jgi:hypothetical protein
VTDWSDIDGDRGEYLDRRQLLDEGVAPSYLRVGNVAGRIRVKRNDAETWATADLTYDDADRLAAHLIAALPDRHRRRLREALARADRGHT